MKYVIGINAYHGDASACILCDGELVAAAEEERFRRIKHWAGFPSESIQYCLAEAGVSLSDIESVAVNRLPNAHFWRKVLFAIKQRPDLKMLLNRARNASQLGTIESELSKLSPSDRFEGRVRYVEHHLAHLSSAYYVSPYEDATVVSVDGFGDFASTCWAKAESGDLSVEGRVYFPHSLGILYQAVTQYLGFPNYGDEYKVMGLAPYGKPAFLKKMESIIQSNTDGTFSLNLDYFRHAKERVDYEWAGNSPKIGRLWTEKFEELLGPAREEGAPLEQHHKDIAHSVQAAYEKVFFHMLNTLSARHGTENLCLAGGCAMNSVANGKVARYTPYRNIYVQSAAGDAGGAIGAAFEVWHEASRNMDTRFYMDHSYWGPSYTDSYISNLLEENKQRLSASEYRVEKIADEDKLCYATAMAIADGCVTGWFQGRMEWGPRALGNRSILCDPRRADMKDIMNRKIKRRESFRPFAPSILREAVSEWFEQDDDVPFMMKVFQIQEEQRARIPAVTHVDGSGRLQTVSKETNARYYTVIRHFQEHTGIPIVLNTSFNENEPVVCRPVEALDCFLRTRMDVLVLGRYFVARGRGDNFKFKFTGYGVLDSGAGAVCVG